MPDFSIKIVPVGIGKAGFHPDLPGFQPGDPLYTAFTSLRVQRGTSARAALDHGPVATQQL
ncbi:MAG TPA: hypothetical protein VE604_08060 [Candidatus Polarisedimenticolia bacterium]|nr:hypothetical protein [Candidatus Polarisedimenticolia bacterium]